MYKTQGRKCALGGGSTLLEVQCGAAAAIKALLLLGNAAAQGGGAGEPGPGWHCHCPPLLPEGGFVECCHRTAASSRQVGAKGV